MNDLPDEVLVQIFKHLPPADLLSLARVSERFDRILCEKRIVRKLDFRRCYVVANNALKLFLNNQLRKNNITDVNFNGCNWMTFTQLKVITKLKNLKSLQLMQCRVSWDLLPQLISNSHLETFSWTWSEKKIPSISPSEFLKSMESLFAGLKNLFLEVSNPFHLTYVWFILSYTFNLEVLDISETVPVECGLQNVFQNLRSWNEISDVTSHRLLSLRECRIFLRSSLGYTIKDFVMRIFQASFAHNLKINGFWSSEAGCKALMELNGNREETLKQLKNAEFISLSGKHTRFLNAPNANDYQLAFAKAVLQNTLPNCKCLSLDMQSIDDGVIQLIGNACPGLECLSLIHSYLRWMPFTRFASLLDTCSNISELCLYNTCFHFENNPCVAIGKLKNLKILSLSSCALGTLGKDVVTAEREQDILPFGVRQRRGLPSRPSNFEIRSSRLYPIAENCTKIHTLIIRREVCSAYNLQCDNFISSIKDCHLYCISLLKNLTVLEFGEMPRLCNGQFLPEICQNCTIRDLRLIDIGSKSKMVYHNSLLSALNLCRELKHLKIEQKYDVQFWSLKESLLKCKKLETIKVISEGGVDSSCQFTSQPLIEIINELPELVHLYIVQPIPKQECKKIMKHLERTFKDVRPAFHYEIAPNKRRNLINEFRKFPLYFQK